MMKSLRVFLLAVLVSASFSIEAQTSSEQVIRDDLNTHMVPFLTERLTESPANKTASESDVQVAAERTSSVIIDCFMRELELLALSNNIDRATFMDAMAFAIQWDSDHQFIRQMAGADQLTSGAEACVQGILESEGLDVKGR